MQSIDTVIIGGGQAGLAMSHSLTERGVENIVLERGRIAERWRTERWDSLHLLTPRWQSRLGGWRYRGPDPDGYMSRHELIAYLEAYAGSLPGTIETGVTVQRVTRVPQGYRVDTDHGPWHARHVVLATGECDRPTVPSFARHLSPRVAQVVPTRYRRPEQLPDGGVLVVGASATGVQLAAEIHASGRPVTLSVGRHARLPRTYRGRDIMWWLDRMGAFDERAEDVMDLRASRSQPSLQLVGTPDRRTLDLNVLRDAGVRLIGRARGADGANLHVADDLVENTVAADAKLALLLHRVDAWIDANGLESAVEPAEPFRRVPILDAPSRLDLAGEGIRTVVWATGFHRAHPWLDVPVLDARGEIRHEGGVTPSPGLYVIGLRLLRRRNSNFIDGVARDADELASHLVSRRERSHHAVA